MNITLALSCDDRFVMPTLVCLTSVFENNSQHSIIAYIITAGLKSSNEERFKKLTKIYDQRIEVINVDGLVFESFQRQGRYALPTYFRFILPSILQERKVLYLDGDMIVRKDLSTLWSIDLEGKSCAVVEDQFCDNPRLYNRFFLESTYFNAGMMLINLAYWRDNNITQKLMDYAIKKKELCRYQDQDVLNVVLSNTVIYTDFKYNFQQAWYGNKFSNPAHFSKWRTLETQKKDPVIVHFCVSIKPWYKECVHPLKEEWQFYAMRHKIINYEERHYESWVYRTLGTLCYYFLSKMRGYVQ